MNPYSLRRRLVVVMVAAMSAVLATIAILLYTGARQAAWQQHDDSLLARADALATLVEHDEDGYEFEAPALGNTYVEVWLPDGKQLRQGPPLALPSSIKTPAFVDLQLPDGRTGRAVVLRFKPRDEVGTAGEVTLVLAEGVSNVTRAITWIRNLFIIVAVVAAVMIGALVWWIAGSALHPLDDLARSIDTIDDKSLATRVPVDNQPLELVAPVRKLNDLLTRLERSFARERQFTADVSHELRTPLAGLRTVLEVTALADRSTVEYKTALANAHTIVLQLSTLVENLLTLARLDADHLPIAAEDVDLRDLVDDCWRPHATLAAQRGLTFRNNVPATTVHIDREKLRVILANLLANAAEYTEQGGWIEVDSGDSLIAVTDSGPALPDTTKIFDRLWRNDASRTGTGVHCGIGLALARSLAEHMSLTLRAENRADGSVRFACSRTA